MYTFPTDIENTFKQFNKPITCADIRYDNSFYN